MSAESPRKSSRQGGHVVAPQPVSDRSIIESVAGFINEVVPQAYASTPHGEGKDAITWARFEYGDINDPSLYPDTADDRNSSPPLILVLGYGSGVQVWAIPASGEATEVLSWRQGVVRTLRILPTPASESSVPDAFAHKRPLVAMCDSAGGPSPQFCSLSFISLRGGDQVKNIKFKNPVSDVLANRRSVVVTFPERIAVFDASTLEDRLTVTTCYPCPGPNPNPVALGTRWLAYSERKLMPAHRSSGGTEGEGVQSYTATMLHAAKSFGKGLRELGETVASSLTGGTGAGMQRGMVGGVCGPVGGQQGGNILGGGTDSIQPGVITILDALGTSSSSHVEETRSSDCMLNGNSDNVIAHFLAHSEPIVALSFDPSGMLLLTADKRGHDFHVFRIHPHPGGSSLAAVHHLYILHRGDTTAKVQDIAFAADSRWVAVSTLRGTTHVFPITPYGGPVGIRTHATPHVVNRLSRFHRSAGLTADGRNSPVPTPVSETVSTPPSMPYPNPRLPPYTHPTIISPLAQIRQPMTHALLSASTPTSLNPASQQTYHRNPSMRTLGRTQSSSDDGLPGGIPLRVTACFAPPRAWLLGSPTVPRDTPAKAHKRAVDSLFVMACHGNLIEYDLEPKHAAGVPKEKICDDTAIELEVQPKAQWMLLRPPHSSDLQPPLSPTNPLMVLPDRMPSSGSESRQDDSDSDERWLSQVEIVTHAGPHRRLWMGPQFTFKTYSSTGSGVPLSLLEMEAVEVGVGSGSRPARSNPVNMPVGSGSRPVVPVLIESGSGSSYEQSPRLLEAYGTDGGDSDGSAGPGETQLREDLADAMMESPGVPTRDTGRRVIVEMRHGAQLGKKNLNPVQKVVNPVGTVITLSCASEEGHSSQASDLSECESSSDAESRIRSSSDAESRVRVSETAKTKFCKTSAATDELMHWNYSEKAVIHKEDSNKEPTTKWPAVKQIDSSNIMATKTKPITGDSEIKIQKKDKNSVQNVLDKKCEEKVSNRSRKESKTDLKAIEIQDLDTGYSASYAKQKERELKRENGDDLKSKLHGNSSKSDSESKEENGNERSKELEVRTKPKVVDISKCRETTVTFPKKHNSENLKKGRNLEENLVQETNSKESCRVEISKRSSKLKIAVEESKTMSGVNSESSQRVKKQSEDSDTNSEPGELKNSEGIKDEFLQAAMELEKFTLSSVNLGVKKTSLKTKSREPKVSKYVFSTSEEVTDSESKKEREKHKNSSELLSTTLLNEHHFGEKLECTDSKAVSYPNSSELERQAQVMELKVDNTCSETEAASIKENISHKSVLDKVTMTTPKSWSSIVSSSKSKVKESAEASLFRVSEHFSSDVDSSESVAVEKVEDVDDCSDEGEEKCRMYGNETVAANEDVMTATGNEDESNGNDDDAADYGTTATLGNNKKNRRTKKKRR